MATSQSAVEKYEELGSQLPRVHQGMSAPMANAWASPRAKIAQTTSGVGSTQYTTANNNVATKEPTVTKSPSNTATAVMAINSHDRLKRNRGVRRTGRTHRPVEFRAESTMIQSRRCKASLRGT